jgi:16S rRNA (guanine966-N2)-methyltransferase
MRVIAGKFRGANLAAPPGFDTRPITDRAKETLFNVLGHKFGLAGVLPDIAVLDLFAGSGSLGIEALSRGARSCLFVERGRQALRVIQANLQKLRLEDATATSSENAWTMRVPPADPDGYGVIFVDPPYRDVADTHRMIDLLERLAPRLAADGILVFRHEDKTGFPAADLHMLECVDDRSVGAMRIRFFKRATVAPAHESAEPPVTDN